MGLALWVIPSIIAWEISEPSWLWVRIAIVAIWAGPITLFAIILFDEVWIFILMIGSGGLLGVYLL